MNDQPSADSLKVQIQILSNVVALLPPFVYVFTCPFLLFFFVMSKIKAGIDDIETGVSTPVLNESSKVSLRNLEYQVKGIIYMAE